MRSIMCGSGGWAPIPKSSPGPRESRQRCLASRAERATKPVAVLGPVPSHPRPVLVPELAPSARRPVEDPYTTVTALTNGPQKFVIAVNGGTRVFRNVRGQATIKDLSGNRSRITFNLIP
jgi:hypothetical protein